MMKPIAMVASNAEKFTILCILFCSATRKIAMDITIKTFLVALVLNLSKNLHRIKPIAAPIRSPSIIEIGKDKDSEDYNMIEFFKTDENLNLE